MIGAQLRVLAWFVILATLLSACAPTIRLDEATTGPPIQTSSAPPAASEDVPASHPTPSPTPTPVPTPAPAPQAFALNLYQEGDFVQQYTFEWCVAASIQMMHNLIDDTGASTWTDRVQQGELWEMARARSFNSFNGANPLGWAEVLTEVGMGPYAVVSIADYRGGAADCGARHRRHGSAGRAGHVARPPRMGDERLRVTRRSRPVPGVLRSPASASRIRSTRTATTSGDRPPRPTPCSPPNSWRRSSSSASRDAGAAICRPATCWCCRSPRPGQTSPLKNPRSPIGPDATAPRRSP